MLEFLNENVIQLNGSVLGFEELNEFTIYVVEEGSPYAYLQSKQDENIGFLVVIPFVFFPEYSFELDDKVKSVLDIKSQEQVAVLNLVTINEPFPESTINLLAPLVINITNGHAHQLVLPPNSGYSTSEHLFKKVNEESGE